MVRRQERETYGVGEAVVVAGVRSDPSLHSIATARGSPSLVSTTTRGSVGCSGRGGGG